MKNHPTIISYITGFILSIVFTLAAYALITTHQAQHRMSLQTTFNHSSLTLFIIILAFAQALIQLLFFLHIQREKKPYFNLFIFSTTFVGILILVLGSLWIMNHLNANMNPGDASKMIMVEEGIQK